MENEAEDGDWGPEEKARMMQRGTDCGLMTGKLIVSTGEHFNPTSKLRCHARVEVRS